MPTIKILEIILDSGDIYRVFFEENEEGNKSEDMLEQIESHIFDGDVWFVDEGIVYINKQFIGYGLHIPCHRIVGYKIKNEGAPTPSFNPTSSQ